MTVDCTHKAAGQNQWASCESAAKAQTFQGVCWFAPLGLQNQVAQAFTIIVNLEEIHTYFLVIFPLNKTLGFAF